MVFVSLIGLFITAFGITKGYQALMGIGVYEGYSPSQPIDFIHSVHACENEVDCKYSVHSTHLFVWMIIMIMFSLVSFSSILCPIGFQS